MEPAVELRYPGEHPKNPYKILQSDGNHPQNGIFGFDPWPLRVFCEDRPEDLPVESIACHVALGHPERHANLGGRSAVTPSFGRILGCSQGYVWG